MRGQSGATYLMTMFAIVLIGVTLMALGKQWTIAAKREREAELLFRGNRIKNAIEAYAADYQIKKAVRPQQYPLSLEQLTQLPKRYLPVAYKDPITGRDFELIKIAGQVRGVKSRSHDKPLNQVDFKKAKRYSDILFQAEGVSLQGCTPGTHAVNPLLTTPCPTGLPMAPGGRVTPGAVPAAPAALGGGKG